VTLLDYRGTALPGVLRMNGMEATYWENRGGFSWGPPERLPAIPQGLHLGDDRVRFADLTGNGTADLIVAEDAGGGYYPNDPESGFLQKRHTPLAPDFRLDEEASWLLTSTRRSRRSAHPPKWCADGVPQPEGSRGRAHSCSRSTACDFNQKQPRLPFRRHERRWQRRHGAAAVAQDRLLAILGNGSRWGAQRVMARTPEFSVPTRKGHLAG
jgi:hypothetical protein